MIDYTNITNTTINNSIDIVDHNNYCNNIEQSVNDNNLLLMATHHSNSTILHTISQYTTIKTVIRILLITSILLPLLLSILPITSTILDICYLARYSNKSHTTTFIYATPCMILCLVVCFALKLYGSGTHTTIHYNTLRSKQRSYRYHYTGITLLCYITYFIAYFLCNSLKNILNDKLCNTHNNSVSGHYLFFIYTLFTLLHIHIHQQAVLHISLFNKRLYYKLFFNDTQNIIFFVFYIGFTIFSLCILQDTYYGGYHTLRQILYGCTMAFIFQQFIVDIIEFIDCMDQPNTSVKLTNHNINEDNLQRKRELRQVKQELHDNKHNNDNIIHANHDNNNETDDYVRTHTDIQTEKNLCIVHTSSDIVKSYLQHLLYQLSLYPYNNNTTTTVCGSWLAYRAWSIILYILAVFNVLSFVLFLLTNDKHFTSYSINDIIVCILCWLVIIYLHITNRLTATDRCVLHNNHIIHNNEQYITTGDLPLRHSHTRLVQEQPIRA